MRVQSWRRVSDVVTELPEKILLFNAGKNPVWTATRLT